MRRIAEQHERGLAPIPVVLCVDVEPYERLIDPGRPASWAGYELTCAFLDQQRPIIEETTGSAARYCWFFRLDPQIAQCYKRATWVFERYASCLASIRGKGDHLGIHPHPYRWLEKRNAWLHDFADQAWVNHCVEYSVAAFERFLDVPCRSMRFGDRWLSAETLNFSERLGIRYDLTVEPGAPRLATPMKGELASGSLPDYYRVPREPYVPDRKDFRRPAGTASRALTIIPLTSSYLEGVPLHRRARELLRRGLHRRRHDTPLALWQQWRSPNCFTRLLDRALSAQETAYLAFAIRTSIGARSDRFAAVSSNIRDLLAHPQAHRYVFCTPAELLAMRRAQRPHRASHP